MSKDNVVYKLVLIRHGDSVFSVENRFCGWHDADIAEKGVQDALKAGQVIIKFSFFPFFSNLTLRSACKMRVVL